MEQVSVPSNFRSIIQDFTNDLSITFSEYAYLWEKWKDPGLSDADLTELFQYCLKVYPERFFDILYQKCDIFNLQLKEGSPVTGIYFLPNVDFCLLFNCDDVTDNTKKTIWKYLQLILFTIVGNMKDKTSFGDAMNMFEGINESELNDKLTETMGSITDFFKNMENMMDGLSEKDNEESNNDSSEKRDNSGMPDFIPEDFSEKFKETFGKMGGLPDIEKIKDNIKMLFDSKIGKLAKEMAEEISEELKNDFANVFDKDDIGDSTNPQDVMKKLMKDPKKLMGLMKSVGGKLDSKMKSGEISKDELVKEASEMLEKMKEMGGTDQFNDILKNIARNMGGMGGMGKNMKIDKNALERMTSMNATKQRMKSKIDQRKMQKEMEIERQREEARKRLEMQQKLAAKYSLESKDSNPQNLVFKLDGEEQQEKSFIHPDILKEIEQQDASQSQKSGGSSKKKKSKK